MAYCGPRGIPLSQFLAWDALDQDAALAWQAHESRRCGGCDTHPDDWNPALGGDRQHAWHAEHYICPGCAQTEQVAKSPQVEAAGNGVHVRMSRGPRHHCQRCAALAGG